MRKITTLDGIEIFPMGLCTYPFQGEDMCRLVENAVSVGYRLFDTADDYRGETGIGMAVERLTKSGRIKRENLFLQTKISADASYNDEPLAGVYFNKYSPFMQRHSVAELVREKVHISLREMRTEYLDSLLIHLPYEDYFPDIWEAMIRLKEEGKIRYLGVSNFHPRHIEQLPKEAKPDINEIYISPIGTKETQVEYAGKEDILLMTYSPLMDVAAQRIKAEGAIKGIMQKYGKTLAQIVLRWNVDRGCIPLPRTKNPMRLKENFSIFDFQLTADEIETISSMNRAYQYMAESTICPGI